MKLDRVNLRSSLHLGASTLLFDVHGAPKYSTGPNGAISLLGLDHDLGGSGPDRVRSDGDRAAGALLGHLPLYYEQFWFVIGVQFGA